MWYLRVVWHHDFPGEPVEYFSEVNEDGWEVSRVQCYRDGRLEWADESQETDMAGLSGIPIAVEEITHSQISMHSVRLWQSFKKFGMKRANDSF
ncbi:hypothetical protein [Actinoplanes sp. TFC3]|uniref:DUF6881 domain-containing protein n=1 Tax=Actinoplanes sp. TFC3 TaxID=1710355 RepID=UPI000A93C404